MRAKMHHDEIDHSVELVRQLLVAQHPQWADLPITAVDSTGTDNALYRLGDHLVARLPLRPSSTKPIDKEHRWLPVLAPLLPLAIPVPLARCAPTEIYPWTWSVYPWFDGVDATTAPLDLERAAVDLAAFMRVLHSLDPTGGPVPSRANFGRGVPLADRDRMTREAIAACAGLVDTAAVSALWEEALHAPVWDRAPAWVNGDIASGNLLVQEERLTAVIDWGGLGVGDPAVDLIVAWELFDGPSRDRFRHELDVDDAMWARGRGWALSTAVMALPYYQDTNPYMARQAAEKLTVLLATAG